MSESYVCYALVRQDDEPHAVVCLQIASGAWEVCKTAFDRCDAIEVPFPASSRLQIATQADYNATVFELGLEKLPVDELMAEQRLDALRRLPDDAFWRA